MEALDRAADWVFVGAVCAGRADSSVVVPLTRWGQAGLGWAGGVELGGLGFWRVGRPLTGPQELVAA